MAQALHAGDGSNRQLHLATSAGQHRYRIVQGRLRDVPEMQILLVIGR